ncbi:MAG: Hsp20/alpha crystallin family protein [Syntrophobacterales bacterium]|nr:Hsp20/alpha crystallin family protein [Syntrophobacterales bacterium]
MDYIKIRFVDNQEGAEYNLFRTVEEMLNHAQPRFAFSKQRWRPHVDIYETGNEIFIIAEIAGIQSEGIDLEISPRSLKIAGKRSLMFTQRSLMFMDCEESPEKESGCYCLAEIPSGHFERTIVLPVTIDAATAKTVYKDGLLKISLTKKSQAEISRITVKVQGNHL